MAEVKKNPWLRGSLNLTEQARILRESPTLAEELKTAAEKLNEEQKPEPPPQGYLLRRGKGGRRKQRGTWLAGGR